MQQKRHHPTTLQAAKQCAAAFSGVSGLALRQFVHGFLTVRTDLALPPEAEFLELVRLEVARLRSSIRQTTRETQALAVNPVSRWTR